MLTHHKKKSAYKTAFLSQFFWPLSIWDVAVRNDSLLTLKRSRISIGHAGFFLTIFLQFSPNCALAQTIININEKISSFASIESSDGAILNVGPEGSIITGNKDSITSSNFIISINILGNIIAEDAQALYLDSTISGFLELRNGGKLINNSATKSTVNYNSIRGFLSRIDKESSVTNYSSNQSATSYAFSIQNSIIDIENSGTISGPNGILVKGEESFKTYAENRFKLTNSGTLKSNLNNYAIQIEGATFVEINNSGTIIGDIKILYKSSPTTGKVNDQLPIYLNNSGTIIGSIALGNDSIEDDENGEYSSYINLESGGKIIGDISFGNLRQNFNIAKNATFDGQISGILSTINLAGNLNFTNSGNFTGNIIGSGTGNLNLGTTTQIIDGNLTLNSGDNLGIRFSSDDVFGNITTSGSANIDANTKISVSFAPNYISLTKGSKYKIVQGDSGSNIQAINNQNINSNQFSILKFGSEVVDNSLYLVLLDRADASYVSSNYNSRAVYHNLSQIGFNQTGNMALFQKYIDISQSRSDTDKVLQSAIVQSDDGIRQNSLNILANTFRSIENKLDQDRVFLLEKRDTSKKCNFSADFNQQSQKNIDSWIQIFNTSAKQEASDISNQGYNSNINGIIFGFEKTFNKKINSGLAFALANSTIDSLDNLKETNVETYQINAYSGYLGNKIFFDSILSFSFNNYKSKRDIKIINSRSNGNFGGNTYSAKIRSGVFHKINQNFIVIPQSSLTFSSNNVGSYTENGAENMNLKVQSNKTDFLEGLIGINFLHKNFSYNDFSTSQQLKISYGYDFIGKQQTIISGFEGQNTNFITKKAEYDQSSLRLGFSIDFSKINSFLINGEYGFEHKAQYNSHSLILRGSYNF